MQVDAYYVAGRAVPPVFNGMATAADWMSGASFVAMAGGIYMGGHGYLAFVVGWTGGYVLVAVLMAPYLRKFGCYTVPDFIGTRYGGNLARFLAVLVLVIAFHFRGLLSVGLVRGILSFFGASPHLILTRGTMGQTSLRPFIR